MAPVGPNGPEAKAFLPWQGGPARACGRGSPSPAPSSAGLRPRGLRVSGLAAAEGIVLAPIAAPLTVAELSSNCRWTELGMALVHASASRARACYASARARRL